MRPRLGIAVRVLERRAGTHPVVQLGSALRRGAHRPAGHDRRRDNERTRDFATSRPESHVPTPLQSPSEKAQPNAGTETLQMRSLRGPLSSPTPGSPSGIALSCTRSSCSVPTMHVREQLPGRRDVRHVRRPLRRSTTSSPLTGTPQLATALRRERRASLPLLARRNLERSTGLLIAGHESSIEGQARWRVVGRP